MWALFDINSKILFRMWSPKLLKSCSAKQAEDYITSVLQQQICGMPNKKTVVPYVHSHYKVR